MGDRTVFDFSSYYLPYTNDRGFLRVSAYLIDIFVTRRDVLAFFSFCQYVAQQHISLAVFLAALQRDVGNVTVVSVLTAGDLDLCYQKYLPERRTVGARLKIKCRSEVYQFLALGLFAFAKPTSHLYNQPRDFEPYMQHYRNAWRVPDSHVTHSLTNQLFLEVARASKTQLAHCRVEIVRWVLDRKKHSKKSAQYLRKVKYEWRNAHMVYTALVISEIYENRPALLQQLWRMRGMSYVRREVQRFDLYVMPLTLKPQFPFLRLLYVENKMAPMSALKVPVLVHVAAELAKTSVNTMTHYVPPSLPESMGYLKQRLLQAVRETDKCACPHAKKLCSLVLDNLPMSARQKVRAHHKEKVSKRSSYNVSKVKNKRQYLVEV